MTKTSAAFQHALRKSRKLRGECQGCGNPLENGYGLMGGSSIGYYEFCSNRTCQAPDFFKWPDPEMDEHTSDNSMSADVHTSNDDV